MNLDTIKKIFIILIIIFLLVELIKLPLEDKNEFKFWG